MLNEWHSNLDPDFGPLDAKGALESGHAYI